MDMDVFQGRCVLYERHAMQLGVTILPLTYAHRQEPAEGPSSPCTSAFSRGQPPAASILTGLQPPDCHLEAATTALLSPEFTHMEPGIHADFAAGAVHVVASSPVQPPVRLELDLASGAWQPQQPDAASNKALQHLTALASKHQPLGKPTATWQRRALQQLPGWWSKQDEGSQQRWQSCVHHVASTDGSSVPLTVSHSVPLPLDGSRPALLVVYGAYGSGLAAGWELQHAPLLARGWSICHAHVRGGVPFVAQHVMRMMTLKCAPYSHMRTGLWLPCMLQVLCIGCWLTAERICIGRRGARERVASTGRQKQKEEWSP